EFWKCYRFLDTQSLDMCAQLPQVQRLRLLIKQELPAQSESMLINLPEKLCNRASTYALQAISVREYDRPDVMWKSLSWQIQRTLYDSDPNVLLRDVDKTSHHLFTQRTYLNDPCSTLAYI